MKATPINRLLVIALPLALVCFRAFGQYYYNPIIQGWHETPSACRVDKEYYCVATHGRFLPNMPIYTTTDLVHWSLKTHGIPAELQPWFAQLPAGTWHNPTLRFFQGKFYLMVNYKELNSTKTHVFLFENQTLDKSFERPIWQQVFDKIEPDVSIFFENEDRAILYYTMTEGASSKITAQVLNLNTLKAEAPIHVLITDHVYKPRVYQKNGLFYLMLIHGQPALHAALVLYRSGNPFKGFMPCPYNPVLSNRQMQYTYALGALAGADLLEAHNGEWWLLSQTQRLEPAHEAIGPEVSMAPVLWPKGEWPILAPGIGILATKYPIPGIAAESNVLRKKKLYDFTTGQLPTDWYSSLPNTGWLETVKGKDTRIFIQKSNAQRHLAIYGLKVDNPNFALSVKWKYKPKSLQDEAGLCVWYDDDLIFKLVATNDGLKIIKQIEGVNTEVGTLPYRVNDEQYLKVEQLNYQLQFAQSNDAKSWKISAAIDLKPHLAGTTKHSIAGVFTTSAAEVESNSFVQIYSAEFTSFP